MVVIISPDRNSKPSGYMPKPAEMGAIFAPGDRILLLGSKTCSDRHRALWQLCRFYEPQTDIAFSHSDMGSHPVLSREYDANVRIEEYKIKFALAYVYADNDPAAQSRNWENVLNRVRTETFMCRNVLNLLLFDQTMNDTLANPQHAASHLLNFDNHRSTVIYVTDTLPSQHVLTMFTHVIIVDDASVIQLSRDVARYGDRRVINGDIYTGQTLSQDGFRHGIHRAACDKRRALVCYYDRIAAQHQFVTLQLWQPHCNVYMRGGADDDGGGSGGFANARGDVRPANNHTPPGQAIQPPVKDNDVPSASTILSNTWGTLQKMSTEQLQDLHRLIHFSQTLDNAQSLSMSSASSTTATTPCLSIPTRHHDAEFTCRSSCHHNASSSSSILLQRQPVDHKHHQQQEELQSGNTSVKHVDALFAVWTALRHLAQPQLYAIATLLHVKFTVQTESDQSNPKCARSNL